MLPRTAHAWRHGSTVPCRSWQRARSCTEKSTRFDEERVAKARIVIKDDGEPEMAELPDTWNTFDDGTPVPDLVALLERSRREH